MVLRRALLYVPASAPRMITKSRLLPTLDTVTYDLEDSVTPALKSLARTHITQTLNLPRAPGIREQSVRINDIRSGYAEDDLRAALAGTHLDAIVIPKVNSPADLKFVRDIINASSHPNKSNIKLLALIESARAVMDLRSICSTHTTPPAALIFAAEDFALDLSLRRTPSLSEFAYARQAVVTAAKAFGVESAIDLVCIGYRDPAVLEEECRGGVGWGFNGKQCIHPDQVGTVQEVFGPVEEEVRWAVRVEVAGVKAEREGRGSWGLDGNMVDRPVVERARMVLERAMEAGWGEKVSVMKGEEEGVRPE